MKNKEQLLLEIDQIPKFEFKAVSLAPLGAADPKEYHSDAVGSNAETPWARVKAEEARAITEEHSNHPLSFVSGRYQLVQFKPGFDSIINDHAECAGNVYYNQGFGVLDVFPQGDDYLLPNGQQLGLSAYNSVNKTSALIVRFSISDGSRVFTLPKNISSFYKAHVGAAAQQQQEYIGMLNNIKDTWITAMTAMQGTEVTLENIDTYADQLETDPRILKAVKLEISAGQTYNLWTMAMRIYDEMVQRYAKSDIHRRKRIDNFVESLTVWGTVLKLGV